jgi:hypothetical protein
MFPIYKTEKEIKELEKKGYEVMRYGAERTNKNGEKFYNVKLIKHGFIIMS